MRKWFLKFPLSLPSLRPPPPAPCAEVWKRGNRCIIFSLHHSGDSFAFPSAPTPRKPPQMGGNGLVWGNCKNAINRLGRKKQSQVPNIKKIPEQLETRVYNVQKRKIYDNYKKKTNFLETRAVSRIAW